MFNTLHDFCEMALSSAGVSVPAPGMFRSMRYCGIGVSRNRVVGEKTSSRKELNKQSVAAPQDAHGNPFGRDHGLWMLKRAFNSSADGCNRLLAKDLVQSGTEVTQ